MRKYAAEIFGTFALVFCGTGAVVIDTVIPGSVSHVGIAITFGLVVMAMVYALGDVSGAHLNPAVTVGFWLARRMPGRCVGPYIVSQLLGAIVASLLLRAMFSNVASLGATLPAGSAGQSFALEAVLTALLMFVILCVSTGSKEMGMMAGIAIGGVIGLEAMFAGPICGASMNPARSLAPALVSGHLQSLWVYLAGPMVGAAISVPCWQLTRGHKTPFPSAEAATHELPATHKPLVRHVTRN
jgi:aquaporin Z